MSVYTSPAGGRSTPLHDFVEQYYSSRRKRTRYTLDIPNPRIVSYNINGYTAIVRSKREQNRSQRVVDNLKSLMKTADIILIQETHSYDEATIYDKFRSQWFCYKNCFTTSSAGTDVWVSKRFQKNFSIVESKDGIGRVQCVSFYPLDKVDISCPVFRHSFSIVNVYLHHGNSNNVAKKKLLKKLGEPECNTNFVIMGGDFNIVSGPLDALSENQSPASIRYSLDDAMGKAGLSEVPHDGFTHLKTGENMAQSRTIMLTLSFSPR